MSDKRDFGGAVTAIGKTSSAPLRVAIAGFGAIGSKVAKALNDGIPGCELVAVSARDQARVTAEVAGFRNRVAITDIDSLEPLADIVVECAPSALLSRILTPFLKAGKRAIVLGVGALLGHDELIELARQHRGQIIVPTGALIGLDAVTAAAEGTIHSVTMISRKPPRGLLGAPHLVKHKIEIEGITTPLRVFTGTAREAAIGFPANLNVVAALALAGIGPDRTTIEVWADPGVERNIHRIEVDAEFGELLDVDREHPERESENRSHHGFVGDLLLAQAWRTAAGRFVTAPGKTVATTLVEGLRALGVKYVFGVPSGGWVDYMEALRQTEGIEFILATHEGGAGMMADVCGRLGDAPGACFGTFGPGATNLATGVGEALLDRSPVIAFTDEMPQAMRGRTTQMGIDHQALFRPLTKNTTRLRADNVTEILFDAAQTALAGRPGPVHIGLPVGLSAEAAAGDDQVFVAPQSPLPADAGPVARAVELLKAARKPLLAVGLGAVRARVQDQIHALSAKHGIPVVLTPMAKGMLAEDDPRYAGVLFHALSDVVGQTHQQADLVVAIGYDPVEFNYESWLPKPTTLISLDVVPADIEAGAAQAVVDVVGDIKTSLDALLAVPAMDKDWDLTALAERRAAMFAKLAPSNHGFGPKGVLAVLRELLPEDGIMTCDVGAHTHLIGQAWRTPAPGTQIMTNGWSTMGFGIPAAIAAKLMRPEQAVCAVVGDGGFLMTVGELATAVRYNLKIVVIVLTDNDLALIRIKQQKKGNPIYGTPVRSRGAIGGPDIFGVPVRTARDAVELRQHLEAAFAGDGPAIVEAMVDSREYDDVVLRKDRP